VAHVRGERFSVTVAARSLAALSSEHVVLRLNGRHAVVDAMASIRGPDNAGGTYNAFYETTIL